MRLLESWNECRLGDFEQQKTVTAICGEYFADRVKKVGGAFVLLSD
jgi:hypothetical protein